MKRNVNYWDPLDEESFPALRKSVQSYASLTISLQNDPLNGVLSSANHYFVVNEKVNPFQFWNVFLTSLYNEVGQVSLMTHVFNDLRCKRTIHIVTRVSNDSHIAAEFKDVGDNNCMLFFAIPQRMMLVRGRDYNLLKNDKYRKDTITTIDIIKRHLIYWSRGRNDEGVSCAMQAILEMVVKDFLRYFQCVDVDEKHLAESVLLYIIAFSYPSEDFPQKSFTIINPDCYSSNNREYSSGGVFIVWDNVPNFDINRIVRTEEYSFFSQRVELYFQKKTTKELLSFSALQATKSAIGSIMSRNGSHNIGSHVLAALSHNVGTMPDDRVLYQYIQHRMDYIATATTEFPMWKQPILFVGNLMRTFFSQRHLLDYIVGSEGLHGYKFQDKNLTVGDVQENTVRIHVRKRKDSPSQQNGRYEGKIGDKGFVEFVSYENPDCAGRNIPLDEDVELAIPGGIVGQHAFYTIIENVLRNAAKHDWAHFDKGQKAVEKWLDVYIDFWDCAEEGKVEFLIWCEQAILGYGADCANATLLSDKNLEVRVKRVSDGDENAFSGLSLIQKLQVRVNAPFIDRSGKLRSENWGLAEMRISAGYLQGRDISEIGGLEKKDGKPDVVSPAIVYVKDDKEREKFIGRHCLGYRFYVEKPKELLVIVSADNKIPNGATMLAQHGIYFNKYSKDLAKKSLPYAYVVTAGLNDEEYKTWALPFRTLSTDKYKAECDSAVRKRHVGLENWIPHFDAYDKVLRIANGVTKKSAKSKAQEIMDLVYTAWTKFVIEKRLKNDGETTPKVLLSILTQENSAHAAGKGLVTTLDLLNMVFEHCFNTSIRAYAKMTESLGRECAEILSLLLNIRKKASLTPQSLQEQNIDVDDSSKIICLQMLKWLESTTEIDSYLAKWERNEVELIPAGAAVPKDGSGVMRHFTGADIKQIVSRFKDYLNCRLGNLKQAAAATTVRERRKAREALGHPMSAMANFFAYLGDSALEQARVFLTKYEEDIVTLPKGYDVDGKYLSSVKCDQWYFLGDERGAWDVEVSYCGNTKASDEAIPVQTVEYKRHFDSQKEAKRVGAKDFPNLRYIEALSGTQAYLNSLVQMTRRPKGCLDKRMASMLLEVGLMRIVIIDERVAKFASDHCDVGAAFVNMGIDVFNEENPFVKALISDDDKSISTLEGKREILIVHQGIIDKHLKAHDSLSVANLINRIVESGLFRYVVITTGRGTPANLPEQARVLPFSTVEGALFKKYPEKFSLVNAVMNILPVKKETNL